MILCEKFVIFFQKLKSFYQYMPTQFSKYVEYLNYWTVYKLEAICFLNNLKPKFYKFLSDSYKFFAPGDEIIVKIYQIQYKTANNIHILYELYRIYYEIKDKTDKKFQEFHKKFMNYYNWSVEKCYTIHEKLCNPLEKFIRFYNNNRSSKLPMCNVEGLPEIPKIALPKSSNGKGFENKVI